MCSGARYGQNIQLAYRTLAGGQAPLHIDVPTFTADSAHRRKLHPPTCQTVAYALNADRMSLMTWLQANKMSITIRADGSLPLKRMLLEIPWILKYRNAVSAFNNPMPNLSLVQTNFS